MSAGKFFHGVRIDDLREIVVLADVRAVLALAFVTDAWAHNLAESVEVVALQAKPALDLLTHALGPGLGAECSDLQLDHIGRHAHFLHGLGQIEGIRRRAGDARDAKVAEQADVLLGIAGGGRENGGTHALHSIMDSETAGEETVAVGDAEDVVTGNPVGSKASCHALAPY